MANRSYQRKLAPLLLVTNSAGLTARVECGGQDCTTTDQWRINGRLPSADIVKTHFTRRGWDISRKATCQACQRKPKMVDASHALKPTLTIATTDAAKSEAARKARRLVYQALEDRYDDVKKRYRPTFSDKTVAKECDVAEAFVKQIREEDFGPLSVPDEVQALRDEAAAMVEAAGKLNARIDALCLRNGWAV